MGRHDSSLTGSARHVTLATGLYASTRVQTAFGWSRIADLQAGDLLVTRDDGLMPLDSLTTESCKVLWSVCLPAAALGNPVEVMLPPGQPVLIRTHYAMPFSGDDLALVPATALEGWHGIAAHVPAVTEPILQPHLSRPAILFAGPGLLLGCPGSDHSSFDLKDLMHTPSRPVLPLAAARHMLATLIAEEASLYLAQVHAADLRAPPNLS
jgi:hypothetical protein